MSSYLLLSLLYATPINAANNSTTETVGWVSDPDGRGTFSLILSCVVTLGLCVWSAMHLNIPAVEETEKDLWIKGIKWGFWGVVAPELVIYSAWKQYYSARILQQEIGKLHEQGKQVYPTEKLGKPEAHKWTMVHGFYAGMGGFVVDLDEEDVNKDELVPGHTPPRLTLTSRGVLLLAKCGLLPLLTKDEIKDKSKADSIAKTLVLVQAGWLIIQLIGRVAQKLPVTLLEVNTLGHVVCAFIIYMMWWHKPRQVETPTRLNRGQVKALAAYMLLSSSMSGWKPVKSGLLQQAKMVPELSIIAYFKPQNGSITERKEDTPRLSIEDISQLDSSSSNTSASTSPTQGSFGPRPVEEIKKDVFEESSIIEQARSPTLQQELRWKLASQAYETYPAVRKRFAPKGTVESDGTTFDWFKPLVEELVVPAMGNWPDKSLLNRQETLVMSTVVWFASILYGAVHIAAWNDHFPSTLEAWLWRSSACFIAWSGAVWVIANSLTDRSKTIYNCWIRILSLQSHWYSYAMLGTAVVVCGTSYIFARVYLVVEAFISMRKLPAAAYDTPDWDRYLPHF